MKGFKIINTILSFVLSLILFLIASLGALYFSFFNEERILANFVSHEYISASYKDFMKAMEAAATPAYISKECYENVFTEDRFSEDIYSFFSHTLKTGELYDLSDSVSDMPDTLYKNIEDYGKSREIEITEAVSQNINEFSSEAVGMYKKYISLSFTEYYARICGRFEKPMLITLGVCVLLATVIALILAKSRYDYRTVFDYLSYSFITAAVFTAIPPFYSLATGLYKSLNISPSYVYKALTDILLGIQNAFFDFAALLLIVGIVAAVVSSIKLRRK